jgi:hypothetical protein
MEAVRAGMKRGEEERQSSPSFNQHANLPGNALQNEVKSKRKQDA